MSISFLSVTFLSSLASSYQATQITALNDAIVGVVTQSLLTFDHQVVMPELPLTLMATYH